MHESRLVLSAYSPSHIHTRPPSPSHIHVCRSWVKTGDGGTRKTSHGFPSSAPPAQPDPPFPLMEVFIIITLVGKLFVVIKTGFTMVTTSVAG